MQSSEYALRMIAGAKTDDTMQEVFSRAKRSIAKFSVVLDQACFGRNICAFCSLLRMDNCHRYRIRWSPSMPVKRACPEKLWPGVNETIGSVKEFKLLLEKNRYGIEVYKLAKQRALRQCPCHCFHAQGAARTVCNCGPWE